MVDYLVHHNANRHWGFPSSAETDEAVEHARGVFATFLNAAPEEIVFGANMTALTFHVSRAFGKELRAGDEIIVTELDHHANIGPWVLLESERGIRVQWARMILDSGQLDTAQLMRLIHERTKLVAIGAASNAIGTVNDLRPVVNRAHEVGALVYVDGVHHAPHLLPDVVDLGCDFYACSPYKFYGPHAGVLYGKRALLEELDFPRLAPAGQHAPERAETGTLSHEAIVGAAAAIEWLASLTHGGCLRSRLRRVYAALHERSARLFERLWSGLLATPGVVLFGPPPGASRTPTAAFVVDGHASSEVVRQLAARGVFASSGDFYAQTVVDRLGLQPEGLTRAGCACYTSEDEIDRLVAGVRMLDE
jgi:cysteine desulfurase family protein (TIGR01976 family)